VDISSPVNKVLKPLKEMTSNEFNHCLKCFIPALRKSDCSMYPPRTLKEIPGEKYFENAPKFKSSPQINRISAALLKQKLCGSGM
jgi:hypothetical protein